MPKTATFPTMADASAWQHDHGGHIYAADNGTVMWFDLSHTITAVMLSPYLSGMSGTVNPRRAA